MGFSRTGTLGLTAILVLVCALGGVRAHGPHEETEAGSSKGGWSLLGTMCFPKGTDTKVNIVVTPGKSSGNNQRILFYDDQEGSWDAAVAAHTCQDKIKLSKEMDDGKKQQGIKLEQGVKSSSVISVNEKFRRQRIVQDF